MKSKVNIPASQKVNTIASHRRVGEWRVIKRKKSQDIREFGITAMSDKQTRKQSMTILCCCCLVTKLCLTLATPWTVACQAPLSTTFFSRGSSQPRD